MLIKKKLITSIASEISHCANPCGIPCTYKIVIIVNNSWISRRPVNRRVTRLKTDTSGTNLIYTPDRSHLIIELYPLSNRDYALGRK